MILVRSEIVAAVVRSGTLPRHNHRLAGEIALTLFMPVLGRDAHAGQDCWQGPCIMSRWPRYVRHIAWREIFPWLHLVRAVGMAMRFRLFLASVAVFYDGLTVGAVGYIFFRQRQCPAMVQWRAPAYGSCLSSGSRRSRRPLNVVVIPWALHDVRYLPNRCWASFRNPLSTSAWWQLGAPFRQLFGEKLIIRLPLSGAAAVRVHRGSVFRRGHLADCDDAGCTLRRQIGMRGGAMRLKECAWPLYAGGAARQPYLHLGLVLRLDGPVAGGSARSLLIGGLMGIFLLGLFFGWPLMWGAGLAKAAVRRPRRASYSYVYQPLSLLVLFPGRRVPGRTGRATGLLLCRTAGDCGGVWAWFGTAGSAW